MPNRLNNDARSNIGSLHQPQAPQKSVPKGSKILVNGKGLTITLTPPSNRVGGQSPANRRSVPKKPNSAAASQPKAAKSAAANQPKAAKSAVASQPDAAKRDKGLADAKLRRKTSPAQMPPGIRQHRSTMQKIGRGIAIVAGGLVGGAIGTAVGFIAGAAAGPYGAAAGSFFGSMTGTIAFGLRAGEMFDELCGGAPQGLHLKAALAKMEQSHVKLTPTQQQRFSQLSNLQAHTLLHVPNPRTWFSKKNFAQPKIAPETRVEIRANVMRLYAKTNDVKAAMMLKSILIERAKAGKPVGMGNNRFEVEDIARAAKKLGLSPSDLTFKNYMADLPDADGKRESSGNIAAIMHLMIDKDFATELLNFLQKVKALQNAPLKTAEDAAEFKKLLKELRDESISSKADDQINISYKHRKGLMASLGETAGAIDDSVIDNMTVEQLRQFKSTDRDAPLGLALIEQDSLLQGDSLIMVKSAMGYDQDYSVIDEAPQSERQAPQVPQREPHFQKQAPQVQKQAPQVQKQAPEVQKQEPQVQKNSNPMLYGGPEFKALVKDLGIHGDIPDAMIEGPDGPVSVQDYLKEETAFFVEQALPIAVDPYRAKLTHLRYAFTQAAEMIENYSPPDGVKDVPTTTRDETAAMLRAASRRAAEKLGFKVQQNDRIGGQQPAPPADGDDIKRADIDMEEEVHNAEPADEEIEKPGNVKDEKRAPADPDAAMRLDAEERELQELEREFEESWAAVEEDKRKAKEAERKLAEAKPAAEEASDSDTESEVSDVEEASSAEEPEDLGSPTEASQGPVESIEAGREERLRIMAEAKSLLAAAPGLHSEADRVLANESVPDGGADSDNDLEAPQVANKSEMFSDDDASEEDEDFKKSEIDPREMYETRGAPNTDDDDDIKDSDIDMMSEASAPREAEDEIEKLGVAPAVEPPSAERIDRDLNKQKLLQSEANRIFEELRDEGLLEELEEQRASMRAYAPANDATVKAARALDMANEALLSFEKTAQQDPIEDWIELDNSLAIQAEKLRLAHGMMEKEFVAHSEMLELPRIVAEITNLRAKLDV